MKIKNLLCAAAAVSVFAFPSAVNAEEQKVYTLTPVDVKKDTSITLYEYDKTTGTLKKVYNELTLNKTTYGSGSASTTVDVVVPNNKTQTVTVNYDSSNVVSTRTQVSMYGPDTITGTFKDIISTEEGGALYIKNNVNPIKNLTGDFIGNYGPKTGGGAVNTAADINNFNANFISNSTNGIGGALYNWGNITSLVGDFIANSAVEEAGGALCNNGTISTIKSNFIGNFALKGAGAIYNNRIIGDIIGDFIANSSASDLGMQYSGALYNRNQISSITGDFVGNWADSVTTTVSAGVKGGAIYNIGSIGKVSGNFIENTVNANSKSYDKVEDGVATAFGGAIYNEGEALDITGDFIGNSANSTSTANIASAKGGAIYTTNNLVVDGDFIGNSANTVVSINGMGYAQGGAIYNEGATLTLSGDFIGNSVSETFGSSYNLKTTQAYGGAIYNDGGILNLSGDFIGNEAISNADHAAYGGAIYNNGGTVNITGNFIDNAANSSSTYYASKGGAIYNYGGIVNINAIDNDIEFSNNTANGESSAIYNAGDSSIGWGVVNFNTDNGHKIYINDTIEGQGTSPMVLNINGDVYINNIIGNTININSGTLKMGGSFGSLQSNLNIKTGATFDVLDNVIREYSLYQLTSDNGNLALDIDLSSNTADKIRLSSSSSSAVLNLSNINVLNPVENKTGKIKVIDGLYGSGLFSFNDANVYTSLGKIYFYDGLNGYIEYDYVDRETYTFANVVKYIDGDRSYSMSQSEVLDRDLDDLKGLSLTVHGNGNTIDGNGYRGINVKEGQTLSVNNIEAKNFKAEYTSYVSGSNRGGFIDNQGRLENLSGTFVNNYSEEEGGVLFNRNVANTISGEFLNNNASYGGAIGNTGEISSISGIFKKNSSLYQGGAIYNEGLISSISGEFINNKSQMGAAITNQGGFIQSVSGVFENNTSELLGGAIVNIQGSINIVADEENTIFTGNKDLTGSNALVNIMGFTNLNANSDKNIVFNDSINLTIDEYIEAYKRFEPNYSEDDIANMRAEAEIMFSAPNNMININANNETIKPVTRELMKLMSGMTEEEFEQMDDEERGYFESYVDEMITMIGIPNYASGTVEFNNKVKNSTVNMFDGTLKFGTNVQDGVEYSGGLVDSNFNYYGGLVTLQNGGINSANLGNMTLHNEMNLSLDADLANETIDTISADSFSSNDNKINIKNINLLSKTDKKEISLSPLSADMDEATRQTMADSMIYSGGDVAYGKIYEYKVDYDPTSANLTFERPENPDIDDFAPGVVANPVAQNGAQSIQLDSFSEAFRNMDTFMLMPENERLTYKYRNKYASIDHELVFDPTMSTYQNNTGWFRPYTTFENIPLKNGPKVSNVTYGSFFGYDSALHELGKGWDGTLGVYAGYTGSHQSFNGNSVYQNGGTLGILGVAYKGNFFTGLTANVGATAGSTSNIQGEDNFTALMGGISSKTGYNFEFANGKVILQPSMIMSYSMVNTFDYTNASGVRMKSDPYHTLQLEPGLKVIGNIGTWQPYANVSMVWNVLNDQKITADNIRLPKYEVKPYVKYGVGLQKRWGEKFTAYGQAYVTNGGRNGVGLQAGLRIAIGDETTKSKAAWLKPRKMDTIIVLDGKVK